MPNSIVHLGAKDAERYGVTGPLEVDLAEVMQDEAEILWEHGVDTDAWVELMTKEPFKRWRVIVWLALRRNGIQVGYTELNFDRQSMRFRSAVEDEPGPGKAPTRAKSAGTTRRRSSSASKG